jgi:hypothetical protein
MSLKHATNTNQIQGLMPAELGSLTNDENVRVPSKFFKQQN